MARDLASVDPSWAWAPFEPTDERPWSRRLAAHLYRRAAFGASTPELDEALKLRPAEAVDRLCDPKPPAATDKAESFEQTSTMLGGRMVANGSPEQLPAWWLYRMLNTADPALEKLTLFWHGHFATSAAKVEKAGLMLAQNDLLRRHARGRFGEMVRGVSRDPAMLVYLDSTTNRRIRPNENFARELLELFCLGVGNYTETDIKQVARAFTGWEVRLDRFAFNAIQHDGGAKTFFGQRGNFDGDDAIKIVLEQPAAPRFIARKLIRYFVFDEPEAPDALVEPLAKDLREKDFEIRPVVRRMLGSNLFFSEHAVGRKVRAPVELGVGLLRALGATTNLIKLATGISELGQGLFYPPNVKGWDGGRAWINSASLLGRANLVRQLVLGGDTGFADGGLEKIAERAGAQTPEQTVDWLLELLVASPVPAAAREGLLKLAAGKEGPSDRGRRLLEMLHVIGTMPEFQLA
jgi:uncharacterized protein (DUF1800 family)